MEFKTVQVYVAEANDSQGDDDQHGRKCYAGENKDEQQKEQGLVGEGGCGQEWKQRFAGPKDENQK